MDEIENETCSMMMNVDRGLEKSMNDDGKKKGYTNGKTSRFI